jgi:hypothetical protein
LQSGRDAPMTRVAVTPAKSWCADTGVAFEVAEACLAHSWSSVVAAYQRSAMVERRRPVMEAWALHVGGETSANVVPFRTAG